MFRAVHEHLDRALALVESVAAVGAGIAMLITVLLVSVDVVMRYVFAAPLTFQFHLVQFYLLVAMVLLALPWGYRHGGAIQIKLIFMALPPRAYEPILRLGLAAASLYMLVLAYEGYGEFHEAYTRSRVVMGVVDWPVAWSWVFVPVGCGLLALRLLIDASAPVLPTVGGVHE